jgi:ketosteroid isomerase-like protein
VSDTIRDQVLDCNRRFYEALEALDLDAMDAVWEPSSRVSTVHPGGPSVLGWHEVRQSLEAIVDATAYIEFEIADVEVHVEDPAAWVTCTERVTGADGRVAELAATNVFVLGNDGWRLVVHHASPVIRPAHNSDSDED